MHSCVLPAPSGPARSRSRCRAKWRAFAAIALLAACFSLPAFASTVIVPDEVSTVQLAIDSGADTVLVREGAYPETPNVERNLVLRGIGVSSRPRLNGPRQHL